MKRKWNVNDLLGSLLLEQGKRQHCWHFHQLFRHLRKAVDQTQLVDVFWDLGHVDNLLDGQLHVKDLKKSTSCSPICGTGASRICTKGQVSAMCSKKCRVNTTCGPRGTPGQGGREPPWRRGASGTSPCGSTRTSTPACPSSVLLRSGACTRTGPSRPPSARDAENERRRRSLRRRALPCAVISDTCSHHEEAAR